ncbi:MAG: hypothetical protein CVU34_20165 [Betaproteobacteria bacterium HGW-Betaproteobacteria-7]|nr:MAG: hypothetical protein CVU34_20165 [Betaproteobacteria bacterium HGW-Betaproteobacteria-7]
MKSDFCSSLLYRYFFFTWLYRDVGRGNLLERSAAWRYNQAHAHWLLTYLRRWLVVDGLAFAAGYLSSQAFQGHWVSIPFFVLVSLAMSVIAVIVVAWLGLRLMPGP